MKLTSGQYSKVHLTKNRLYVLVGLMRNTTSTPIPTSVFRDIICPLLPESAPLTCEFLFNVRFKIKKWMDEESESSPSTKRILELTEPPADLLVPTDLEFKPANFIQDVSRYARQFLLQVSLKTGNHYVAIEHFLCSMSAKDPSFTFRIALDGVGNPSGYVWQSSVQRAYTREYSDIIYLDCMKKRSNTMSWPYIAPVVLDGDNKIGTMVESIICSERLDAYKFVVLAAFEMAKAKKKKKIIFGDGIMGDRLLEDLGITDTCKLCHDEYHLIMED
jgi:hypothetical protein